MRHGPAQVCCTGPGDGSFLLAAAGGGQQVVQL